MSDSTFSTTPSTANLVIPGSDGTSHNYLFTYNNSTWTESGMVDINDNIIAPGESGYIEPNIVYTIQDGTVTANINENENCQRDADFPMYDIDIGIFLSQHSHNIGNTSPGNMRELFENHRCDYDVLDGNDYNYKINSNTLMDWGASSFSGEWAGDYGIDATSYYSGVGSGIVFDKTDTSKILINTQNTIYPKLYKIDPNVIIFANDTIENPASIDFINNYLFNLSLVNNIYINWNNYYDSVYNSLLTNDIYYNNIDTVNEKIKFDFLNSTEQDKNIIRLFGFNTDTHFSTDYDSLNINIAWFTTVNIYNDSSTIGATRTFSNIQSQLVYQKDWSTKYGYDYNEPYSTFTIDCFNEFIDLFTGSAIHCMSNSSEDNAIVAERLGEYVTDKSIDAMFGAIANSNLIDFLSKNSLDTEKWNFIFDFDKIKSEINEYIGWNSQSTGNFQKFITIETVGCIIQQQKNYDPTNSNFNRFLYKKFTNTIQLNVCKLIRDEINNDNTKKYTYTSFFDYPIAYATSINNAYDLVSGSGICGTFDTQSEGAVNNFYSGIIYNLVYKKEENLNNIHDVSKNYYNYHLRKTASCNASNPLTWSNMPTS